MATGEIKNILAVIGGGKEATVLLAENSSNEPLIFDYSGITVSIGFKFGGPGY